MELKLDFSPKKTLGGARAVASALFAVQNPIEYVGTVITLKVNSIESPALRAAAAPLDTLFGAGTQKPTPKNPAATNDTVVALGPSHPATAARVKPRPSAAAPK